MSVKEAPGQADDLKSRNRRRIALVSPLPAGTVAELQCLISDVADRRTDWIPNSMLPMQHRPEMALAALRLSRAVMKCRGRVTLELKRLIAYVVSTVNGCHYCQTHNAAAALDWAGDTRRLEAVWSYESSPLFSEAEKAALRLVIACAAVPSSVTDEIAGEARRHWDDGELCEIVGVACVFAFFNRWNDSIGIPVEASFAEVERFLNKAGLDGQSS